MGDLFAGGYDCGAVAFSQVRIDFLNQQWTSSLVLGVITCPPERLNFPASACALKTGSWLLRGRGSSTTASRWVGSRERAPISESEWLAGGEVGP